VTWAPRPGTPEDLLATLPWAESQQALSGGPIPGTLTIATCGWHGTLTEPTRGAVAVLKVGGPLSDLLGERLRVTWEGASVYVVALEERDVAEHMSLARPAFSRLALLATEQLVVQVEAVG
jgi:hypothetical protein